MSEISRKKASVLAIIPARGGSKGLKNKNLRMIGGLPLIAHTLKAVHGARLIADHIISTDDIEIARVSRLHGGRVPFLRSADLATDSASIIDVVNEVIEKYSDQYEYLMLLQPTSPLRNSKDIDCAVDLVVSKGVGSVVSIEVMETYHPCTMYYLDDDRMTSVTSLHHSIPRQEYPKVGWRNGAIYLVRLDLFRKLQTFITDDCVPYVMPTERSINIDTFKDLRMASQFVNSQIYESKDV